MLNIKREVIDIARAEAAKYGATIEFSQIGKHPRMTLNLNGQCRHHAISASPKRDNRANLIRQDIRRMVKSITDTAGN